MRSFFRVRRVYLFCTTQNEWFVVADYVPNSRKADARDNKYKWKIHNSDPEGGEVLILTVLKLILQFSFRST